MARVHASLWLDLLCSETLVREHRSIWMSSFPVFMSQLQVSLYCYKEKFAQKHAIISCRHLCKKPEIIKCSKTVGTPMNKQFSQLLTIVARARNSTR